MSERATAVVSEPRVAAPVDVDQRIHTLDILRGIALFGMILVHFHQRMRVDVGGVEDLIPWGVWILVEQKAHGTFAFLFGVGFAVLLRRLEARGDPVASIYLRRLAALAVFGVVAQVGFGFATLFGYAYWGVALLLIRRLSTRWLLAVAAASVCAWPVVSTFSALYASWTTASPAPVGATISQTLARAVAEAAQSGSYASLMAARWAAFVHSLPHDWRAVVPDMNLALFGLGMLALHHGVLEAPRRHLRIIKGALSRAWLSRFRFGPLEWVWRCITYARWQPLRRQAVALLVTSAAACATQSQPRSANLAGDWDAYLASGATTRPGFEGWRRMGFAHFTIGPSGLVGSIRRRTGEPLLDVTQVDTRGDSITLRSGGPQSVRGAWHGDTLAGIMLSDGKPSGRRIRLVRRTSPFVAERAYGLWPGAVSDSQYAVTEDTLVFMTTRDGAKLASYIARPVGVGPFGVVLQRTPYTRILHPAGRFWASRGYIFVAQHVRGRDVSDGNDFGDYDTDVRDGYDAVEWAARLPGANGRVGMIGHSDEGRLAWYAAVSAPPHLAAIAPSAATGDPWRIVPYEDMVFSPINVAWACLMRARTLQDISDLDIGAVLTHLPLSDLPQQLGCGRVPLWDRWIAHPTLDAYWRAHAVTTQIARVKAPVLQISGWYDDSRGPIDYTNALSRVPGHPFIRLVMGPGAHKGVDYVAGEFGPQSRVDTRQLQLRWFDHYLLGRDNGVDREPPVDIFVFGDNTWRKEAAWPLARARATTWYMTSGGRANTSGGDGVLDTVPASAAAADTFTYDPANPTPYLIDSRELETSLNEDFTALNAMRRDALVYTSKPLTKPIEVTGQMSATLWAATDAKDTDWNVMLLDVFPDGHAERVQDGVARARFRKGLGREVFLQPGSIERYDIDLWFTSRVFQPGHRIRVTISSALFPKYDRNLNTGGNNERDSTFVVARQRLLHDAAHASGVVLPVIPR